MVFGAITVFPTEASGTRVAAIGDNWNSRFAEIDANFAILEAGSGIKYWKAGGGFNFLPHFDYYQDKKINDVTVGNTVTETSIYSTLLNKDDDIYDDGTVFILIQGELTFNPGADDTITVRMKLASTTLVTTVITLLDQAGSMSFEIEGIIHSEGDFARGTVSFKQRIQNGETRSYQVFAATSGENFTAGNKTVDVTVQWNAAHANSTLTKKHGITHILNPDPKLP